MCGKATLSPLTWTGDRSRRLLKRRRQRFPEPTRRALARPPRPTAEPLAAASADLSGALEVVSAMLEAADVEPLADLDLTLAP